MKKIILNTILLCGIGFGFSGCDEVDNLVGKSGMKCDSEKIISLAEQILNNQIMKESNLKLDITNIVVWDYNKVGRYECKAKVNGLSEKGITGSWMLKLYGLSLDEKTNKISGWVKYNTYKTTTDGYYVQLEKVQ